MNKIVDISLCVLAVPVWIIADVLDLLSILLHELSCFLERFISFLVNKNHKKYIQHK